MSEELQQEKDKLIFFVNCTKHKCGNYGQYLVLIIMNPKFLKFFSLYSRQYSSAPTLPLQSMGTMMMMMKNYSHEKPGL